MTTILETISRFFKQRRSGSRRPSPKAVSLALSGAVMIWTPDGNVVVDPKTARHLAVKLAHLADKAELSMRLSA
jgi:hypothetical protein